nr:Chain A, Preproalbumin PawS1 [Galinsoga quadriradiata]
GCYPVPYPPFFTCDPN